MQSGYGVTGGITMLSPSAPTILFKHLFFNNQKYGGVIQLFSPHIRPILPIIRSFATTLLHQIFRQAQSSICLNSPVLLNLTLFPDRFTVLHINATFLKVGAVSGDPPQKKRSQHITVTAFIDYCFVVTPPYRYRLPIANAIKGGIVSGDSPPP